MSPCLIKVQLKELLSLMEINPNSYAITTFDWTNVVKPITSEQLTKWINNLRSGEYAVGKHRLANHTGTAMLNYCCLGVLAAGEDKLFKHTDEEDFKEKDQFLTSDAFLRTYVDEEAYYIPLILQKLLASINDAKSDFKLIADLLETIFTQRLPELSNYQTTVFTLDWLIEYEKCHKEKTDENQS